MNGVRFALTDLIEFEDMTVSEASFPVPRRIHLDPNNAGTPVGTEANPFTNWRQGAEAVAIDSARRELIIKLKGGVYRDSFTFDADRWERIVVRGMKGQGTIIRPSTALTGAVWTLVSGEVWQATHKWANISGSLAALGGLIETGDAHGLKKAGSIFNRVGVACNVKRHGGPHQGRGQQR
jgi:hypothetical protein